MRHVGSQFPKQGSNLRPLQWRQRVVTARPPGKSLELHCHNLGWCYWHARVEMRHADCILQCTGQHPTTKNYLVQNVNHANTEKPCSQSFLVCDFLWAMPSTWTSGSKFMKLRPSHWDKRSKLGDTCWIDAGQNLWKEQELIQRKAAITSVQERWR